MADDDDNVVDFQAKRKRVAGKYGALYSELARNPLTRGLVGYDTFARRPMLLRPVPVPNEKLDRAFQPRPLEDADFVGLVMHLETRKVATKLTPGPVRDVVGMLLQGNRFSPPADLIRSFKWDGVERLSTFLTTCCGIALNAGSEAERDAMRIYVHKVSRCFFIAICARVFEPGCKVDTVIVFEGEQGILKSSLLRVFALRDEWFSDDLPHDLAAKDAKEHLPGNLIVELAEIVQFKRSEIETVKSFISRQTDKYRPSYGHLEISWPRQNIFVGTTNALDDYLQDTTGNRRFWPLRITSIDLEFAKRWIEQVYAEAYQAYKAGEPWWLDPTTESLAFIQQSARLATDPWAARIEKLIRETMPIQGVGGDPDVKWVTTDDALAAVDIPMWQRARSHQMRVGAVLRQLGGERKKRRRGNDFEWSYRFEV